MTGSDLPTGAVPWRSLLAEAERRLADAGIGDAASCRLDARRIVERASGNEGADFVLGLEEPASARGVHFFDLMLERRLQGEPLQYVVGAWGFRTLDLLVDRRVLIPRPETEGVVEVALSELDRRREAAVTAGRSLLAVDLGTGSGAIALSLAAERTRVDVWATDSSVDALDVARANLAGLGGAGTRVRLVEGDWFAALPDELAGTIDVVVTNPPYVATSDELAPVVRNWEPPSALLSGADGLDDVRTILAAAPRWLAPAGALVVELAPAQADTAVALALAAGFTSAEVLPDLASRPRTLLARTPSAPSRSG